MKYLSKVASLACIAGVSMTLVGCGGGSSTPPVEDNTTTCPIPESVKQDITLDQQSTRAILGMIFESNEIGWDISDSFLFGKDASKIDLESLKNYTIQTDSLNPLEVRVAKTLNSIKPLREIWIDSDVPMGDDLACDEGKYSLHYTIKDTDSEEDGIRSSEFGLDLSIDFDNCVLYEGSDKEKELFKPFGSILMGTSIIANLRDKSDDDNITFSFNGSSKLNVKYLDQGKYDKSDDSWDFFYSIDREVSIDNTNLSVNVNNIEDGQLFVYNSQGTLDSKLNWKYTDNGEKVVGEDGNTTTSKENYNGGLSLDMNIKEFMQEGNGDTYDKEELKAYCYTHSTNWLYSGIRVDYDDNEDSDKDYVTNTVTSNGELNANGYGSWNEIESDEGEMSQNFFDLYQENLNSKVNRNYLYESNSTDITSEDNQTIDINGRVGSSVLGGSASIATSNSWQTSNLFRYSINNNSTGEIQYVWYSPYAGESIISGTNTAVVGFDYVYDDEDDRNETYGYIQIDDQPKVEYDSLEDMIEGYIE